MTALPWTQIVRLVHQRASNCCEYCRTSQQVCGQSMHVEHINPAGGDQPDNLCLACPTCNLSKGKATTALDPETKKMVALFNPRQQRWRDHFDWRENGVIVTGKTAIGRATVERLKMNQPRMMTARRIWIKAGAHPPAD